VDHSGTPVDAPVAIVIPAAADPSGFALLPNAAALDVLPKEQGEIKRTSGADSAPARAVAGPPLSPSKAATANDTSPPATLGASSPDTGTASGLAGVAPASTLEGPHPELVAGAAKAVNGGLHSGAGAAPSTAPSESTSGTAWEGAANGPAATVVAASAGAGHVVERGQPAQVDPYQRMDQGAQGAPLSAAVLHAASNRVAVGIHDPTLGWLEINTQSSAGQLSAALVTGSSQSHDSLTAQLPSITQYLADHQVKVSHIDIEQQMTGGGSLPGHGNAGRNANSGTRNTGNQEHPQVHAQERSPTLQPGWSEGVEAGPLSYISVRA
jgi:hypothetical protein